MKRLHFTFILLCVCLMSHAQNATIILNVVGINKAQGGELSAGIFTKANFPVIGKEVREIKAKVTDSVMQIVFKDIPPGEYGMAVYQDLDNDKKLKTNMIGMPKEPIGFSNDARIVMGPPSFKQAGVKVEANKTIMLKIILR